MGYPIRFMKQERENNPTPQIFEEINNTLGETVPENMACPTVESIAEKIGISKNILYQWAKTDPEFSEALERFKTIHAEDPFKTGTVEDTWIGSMVLAFIIMETRDRHYKSRNS